jgi:hypothetical protein
MIDQVIHFFTYNKIYLFTGVVLFLLVIIPTKEKISHKTKKALYVFVVIWIICFAYRVNTGNDITRLFNSPDDFEDESQSTTIKKGPFSKYYSNDAGREAKD